jgi:hypothetical protein
MVHPDKCDHPQAQEAFMALNKAFKDLQDPTKVSAREGNCCFLLVPNYFFKVLGACVVK